MTSEWEGGGGGRRSRLSTIGNRERVGGKKKVTEILGILSPLLEEAFPHWPPCSNYALSFFILYVHVSIGMEEARMYCGLLLSHASLTPAQPLELMPLLFCWLAVCLSVPLPTLVSCAAFYFACATFCCFSFGCPLILKQAPMGRGRSGLDKNPSLEQEGFVCMALCPLPTHPP